LGGRFIPARWVRNNPAFHQLKATKIYFMLILHVQPTLLASSLFLQRQARTYPRPLLSLFPPPGMLFLRVSPRFAISPPLLKPHFLSKVFLD